MKALIIDNSASTHKTLSLILGKIGYKCLSAYDAEDGWKLLEQESPELIFLDAILPRTDGFETCFKIKSDQRFKDVMVIIETIRSENQDRIIGEFAGADYFLSKPFKAKDIAAALKKLGLAGKT